MKKWILKPSENRKVLVELCGMDLGGFQHFPCLWFFDRKLDPDRFRQALAATIDQYPPFSGKLVKDSGKLFIDSDGEGAHFEYVESDLPCPKYGPDIFPDSIVGLFPQLFPMSDPTKSPLYFSRLTRFADGSYAYASYESHVLRDGSGMMLFLEDLGKNYRGESTVAPEFNRAVIIANGDANAMQPSAVSGLVEGGMAIMDASKAFIVSQLGIVSLAAKERSSLTNVAKSMAVGHRSFNTLFHALIFRAYALSYEGSEQTLRANLSLDLRYVKGIQLPRRYSGNAVLHRSIPFSRREAVEGDWASLFERFADPQLSDPKLVAQDIGFLQKCYEQQRYSDFGLLTGHLPPLLNGGVFINNATQLPFDAMSMGGLAAWPGSAMTDQTKIRMSLANTIDSLGNIRVKLVLPGDQLQRYRMRWRECLHDLISSREIGQ